jgi:hypothetical protein
VSMAGWKRCGADVTWAREARPEVLGLRVGTAFPGKDALPGDSPYTTAGEAIIGVVAHRTLQA